MPTSPTAASAAPAATTHTMTAPSAPSVSPTPSATQAGTTRRAWSAVIAAGLATFSVVTTEMLPVGLLTSIARDLGTSAGTAGLMISLPALLAACFAPIVVLLAGNIDRRRILCGLLGLLAFANAAAALASDIGWMLAARMLVGLCMGGIWAIAGGLAAQLVPGPAVGLATSIIFGGVAAASVLGVPMGALIGDLVGWRWAFGSMALLSGTVLILLARVMPPLPSAVRIRVQHFRMLLADRALQTGLLLTLALVAAHFMAFTFVRPLLVSVSGFEAQWVGPLLFTYGMAGIAGNFLAGIAAAQRTPLTLMLIALGLLLTWMLYLAIGHTQPGAATALVAWGLAYGGVSVGLMTWMMKAAPGAVEIAAALYVGVFNAGIALGAWAGGLTVDRFGLDTTLWLASGLAAIALWITARAAMAERATQ